jgi:hypothetical protein
LKTQNPNAFDNIRNNLAGLFSVITFLNIFIKNSKIVNIYQILVIEFTGMNTSKTLLVSTAVVLALALILAPIAISEDALAKKSNKAKQVISQSQKSKQNSQVISGDSSVLSGNNLNIQLQGNSGSNALAQSND